MDYKAAMKHKAVVAEVACTASATGQWSILGVLFDEVSRLFWEEESGKKGDRFNVNTMVGTGHEAQHEMLLRRAEALYAKLFGRAKQSQVRLDLFERIAMFE